MTVWLAPAAQITSNPGEKRISEVFRWHIRVWNQRAPRAEVESDFCLEGFLCGLRQHLKFELETEMHPFASAAMLYAEFQESHHLSQ